VKAAAFELTITELELVVLLELLDTAELKPEDELDEFETKKLTKLLETILELETVVVLELLVVVEFEVRTLVELLELIEADTPTDAVAVAFGA